MLYALSLHKFVALTQSILDQSIETLLFKNYFGEVIVNCSLAVL